MADQQITRRAFIQDTAAAAAGIAAGAGTMGSAQAADEQAKTKTRSYNPQMEYRRLGKTNLWVSAVCMGGHWKRIDKFVKLQGGNDGYFQPKGDLSDFDKNRSEVVSRCIEQGINLIDACTGDEVKTYARALKGRREKMYLNYSWFEKEMRFEKYRTAPALLQSLDEGLREAQLEYVDVWRITCHERGGQHTLAETEGMIKALETAQKQGKCRFTGLSSHDRKWLKWLIETYPQQIQVVVTPYTADSVKLPSDSIFDAIVKHDVGVLGIKPFSSNQLFKGDSSPNNPNAAEDDRRARLAIRYILNNPAITAPIPGLVSAQQVDNVAQAIKEPRQLTQAELSELRQATTEMWARLSPDYRWLRDWRYV